MDNRPYTLNTAIFDFFSRKPGQSVADILKEIRELTPQDRAEFMRELLKRGYDIRATSFPAGLHG